MRKLLYLFALTAAACMWSAGANAQVKFSGTCACKADKQQVLAVGDRDGHALGSEQYKCDWTKPADFGGDKTKDGVATHTVEAQGPKSRFRGVHVVTTQSGDKVYLPYQGAGETSKDGKESHSKGTFTVAGGTGKLKGATGKGTFTCTSTTADTSNCDVEGEYQAAK
jgi:hypothetical protein